MEFLLAKNFFNKKIMAFVYILQSLKNGSYYIGSTRNVQRRLEQHNSGNVQATKYKRPYKLVFFQEFASSREASMAEKKIRSWKRKDFIEKVIESGKFLAV